MISTTPVLSVIVASTAPLQDVPTCVQTLMQCRATQPVEIILAYAADRELSEASTAPYTDVTFIRLPRASLPQLLGTAIARANGEIMAITDATCAIDEHWISATLEAHTASYPVIGGAVEPDGLSTLVDWAGYFCDYGQFMFPLNTGVVRHVPGINISLKRWALSKGREFVEGEFWKAYWCRHLQVKGFPLHIEPSMLVFYRRSFSFWPFLRLRFHHGRCFAGMRRAQITRWRRFMYVLGSPLLPVLFCLRFIRALFPKRRHIRQLVLSFPIVVLAMVGWALGEFCGYLSGPNVSCRHVR
ncbi:MAG TPA: hypothetical protein VGW77_18180 [Candidatus Binatia bacterium]|jgi:hypothetical protein|nr:hypothetical protein [Candidatus Binatia bacterium]